MVTVRRNPDGIESTYIDCLNTCFGGWGGLDLYRWAFERTVGSHTSDILLLDFYCLPIRIHVPTPVFGLDISR